MSVLDDIVTEHELADRLGCPVRDMSDQRLERCVAEILEYPLAGRLPDGVVAGLCVWWLRARGVLPK